MPIPSVYASELRLLGLYNAVPAEVSDEQVAGSGAVVNEVPTTILHRFHGAILDAYQLLLISDDGNCFYQVASLALFGTQERHLYMRLITTVELILHPESYDVASASAIRDIPNLFVAVSPFPCVLNPLTCPIVCEKRLKTVKTH